MRKTVVTILILLLSVAASFAQEAAPKDIIVLRNGDRLTGVIVLQTDETVMIQTDDGKRFQFQIGEIERIEQEKIKSKVNKMRPAKTGNFGVLAAMELGLAKSSEAAITAPDIDVSVAFGSKNAFGSETFAGIGAGFELIPAKAEDKRMTFIPIFLQIHKNLTNNNIKPFIGTKIGHAISVHENYKGGTFALLTSGINFPIAQRSSINAGIFGKIQQIKGSIIEKNKLGDFIKNGTTQFSTFGVNISFIF